MKIFHRPEELTASLEAIGWRADLSITGTEFFYGVAYPSRRLM